MNVKTKHGLAALIAILTTQTEVHALTPPSDSDGPIKLLTCTVSPQGILEAEVDSQTDDDMSCNIRCNYELGERMFSQSFNVTAALTRINSQSVKVVHLRSFANLS